jgi:hypothetical protein
VIQKILRLPIIEDGGLKRLTDHENLGANFAFGTATRSAHAFGSVGPEPLLPRTKACALRIVLATNDVYSPNHRQ